MKTYAGFWVQARQEFLARCATLGASESESWKLRAMADFALGLTDQAGRHFHDILNRNTNDVDALTGLGQVYLKRGQVYDAVQA